MLVHKSIDFSHVIFFTGLCLTLLVEVAILRLTGNELQQQTWKINLLRSLFAATSLVQLMHAIFTYRYMSSNGNNNFDISAKLRALYFVYLT